MKENNRRLIVPLATFAGCLALLLGLIALASRDGASDDNPAVGFPIVLVGLAVIALVVGLAWRSASRKKSASRH